MCVGWVGWAGGWGGGGDELIKLYGVKGRAGVCGWVGAVDTMGGTQWTLWGQKQDWGRGHQTGGTLMVVACLCSNLPTPPSL